MFAHKGLFAFLVLISLRLSGQDLTSSVTPNGFAVIVTHIDVSAKWYERLLGLKQVNRMVDDAGTYKVVILESPQMVLELLERDL